jgi:predicted site-specific integrase-resolvase
MASKPLIKPLVEHEPILIRKEELARRLSVSARTIDNWLCKRLIPVIATSQRMHLFDLEEVRAALEKRFKIEPR